MKLKRIVITVLLCGICLVGGVIVGWWLRGPPPGTKQMLDILAEMAAKPSTEGDWKALTVAKSTATVSEIEMPVVTIKNVRPVLEADANTSAQHLSIQNTRHDGVLKTLIFGPKMNNALEIEWLKPAVVKAKRPEPYPDFYLGPDSQPARERYKNDYYISGQPNDTLVIKTPSSQNSTKWERNSYVSELYFFRQHRYAVAIERSETTKRAESLVIVDIENGTLAGIVPLPPQIGRYKPLLLIDPNTDLLLCIDLDIAWIVCVDLRAGIDQTKKPWPPPWPHPALGPWHGNDDVNNGRFAQTPAQIPPKPADYP